MQLLTNEKRGSNLTLCPMTTLEELPQTFQIACESFKKKLSQSVPAKKKMVIIHFDFHFMKNGGFMK